MSLPDDCIQFLRNCNLLHHQSFFVDLGVASYEDFYAVESSDVKGHLKPLEERRFFRAVAVKKSELGDSGDLKTTDFQGTDADVAKTDKNEKCRNEELSQSQLQDDEPGCSKTGKPQSVLFSNTKPTYMNAVERGIKLWSDFQIKSAVGLEKKRREFFNSKVEELCNINYIKRNWTKAEISGAADTAWTLKKTALLQVEAKYVQELTKDLKIRHQKTSTINKNQEEMLLFHKKLTFCDQEVRELKNNNISTTQKEEEMMFVMRKLKNSQEALRKALQERLSRAGENKSKINADFEEMPLSVELRDFLEHNSDSESDASHEDEQLTKKLKV